MCLSHYFVIGYHNVLVLVESTYHLKDATCICFWQSIFSDLQFQRIGFRSKIEWLTLMLPIYIRELLSSPCICSYVRFYCVPISVLSLLTNMISFHPHHNPARQILIILTLWLWKLSMSNFKNGLQVHPAAKTAK